MKRKFLIVLAIVAVTCWAAVASADTFSFFNITNNTTNTGSGFFVDVTAAGSGSVLFTFRNTGPAGSSIDAVYFDDGSLLNLASLTNSSGVQFTQDAISTVNPGNLPGGNSISPPFVTHALFSADADAGQGGVNAHGINNLGETLGITFTLIGGQTFADTLAAIASGDLRIGIHVQSIPPTGKSDSFVNTPAVPIPPTALLLGSGLLGIIALGVRRRKG